MATAEKGNDITVIPRLLNEIQVKGRIITIDAMGCQTEIAAKIVSGGEYCLGLKGNQGNLHATVVAYIEMLMLDDFAGCEVQILESQEKVACGRTRQPAGSRPLLHDQDQRLFFIESAGQAIPFERPTGLRGCQITRLRARVFLHFS